MIIFVFFVRAWPGTFAFGCSQSSYRVSRDHVMPMGVNLKSTYIYEVLSNYLEWKTDKFKIVLISPSKAAFRNKRETGVTPTRGWFYGVNQPASSPTN